MAPRLFSVHTAFSAQPLEKRTSSLLIICLYILGLAISAQLVWWTLVDLYGKKGADFSLVIYEVARAVPRGEALYDEQRVARDLFGPAFHLPPFAALVSVPFGILGEDEALQVWRALSLAAHFGSLSILLRTLKVAPSSPLTPAALAVWAFFWPARFNLVAGQWDAFFLLALAGVWWAECRRRGTLAGALLALAGSVKPYPLLALGYFGARRRWHVVLVTLVGMLLFFGLAYLLIGARHSLIFLQAVAPHLGATTAYVENQSLAGFLARLVEPEMRPLPTHAPIVYALSRLLLVGLLITLALLGLRAARGPLGGALQYATWIAAVPIVIPVAWMHYQELLLLPFLVLAAAWFSPNADIGPNGLERVLYSLALGLVAFGDHYTVIGSAAEELWKPQAARVQEANEYLLAQFAGPAVLLLSYKLYGALLLWCLCVRAAWRRSAWAGRPASWYNFFLGRQEAGRSLPPQAGEESPDSAEQGARRKSGPGNRQLEPQRPMPR